MNELIAANSNFFKLRQFCRLISIVLLQDMRGRYGGTYISYFIAIGWPLTHLYIIWLTFIVRTQIAPIGDSPSVFVATGAVPYILCFYPSRLIALAIASNFQLLQIPIIKPIHLIISRAILESLNGVVVLFLFVLTCYIVDIDMMPSNLLTASSAIAASIFFGVCFGFFNVVLISIFGMFYMMIFIGIMIVLYMSAGVYIPIQAFPDSTREAIAYNPIAIIVEWLRSAYYGSYETNIENQLFLISISFVLLVIGLAGERFMRGKIF